MKNISYILRAGSIAMALAATTAVSYAQPFTRPFIITADENANQHFINFDQAFPYPADVYQAGFPVPATSGGGVAYALPVDPSKVTLGTLWLTEGTSTTPSDSITWMDGAPLGYAGNTLLIFRSDAADETPADLADVSYPLMALYNPNANNVFLAEEGTEGNWNGIHYTPLSGGFGPNQPGYYLELALGGGTLQYEFTSDVPEPTSLALLGLAGAAVLLRKRS